MRFCTSYPHPLFQKTREQDYVREMRNFFNMKFSSRKLPIVGRIGVATTYGCDSIAFGQLIDFLELQGRSHAKIALRFAIKFKLHFEARNFEQFVKKFCEWTTKLNIQSYPHLIHPSCGEHKPKVSLIMKRLLPRGGMRTQVACCQHQL